MGRTHYNRGGCGTILQAGRLRYGRLRDDHLQRLCYGRRGRLRS